MKRINPTAIALIVALFALSAFGQATRPFGRSPNRPIPAVNPNLPTLWVIGDSTVRNGQDRGENGQWGWGNPIAHLFDRTKINVVNYALGGTSSRTFMNPGRGQTLSDWDMVMNNIKPGDFVIMQFGHNDGGKPDDPSRARATLPGNGEETVEIDNPITMKHETVHTYGWYIRKYCTDATSKGAAEVIVCSLIPRNHWADGKVDAGQKYPAWAEAAAKQVGADYVDLHSLVAAKYEPLGEKVVTDTYYPDKETTHTDWAGAILNAQCVCEGIKGLPNSKLAAYLLTNPPTEIALPSGKAR
jgi:lysophospholipase L1-like esterase